MYDWVIRPDRPGRLWRRLPADAAGDDLPAHPVRGDPAARRHARRARARSALPGVIVAATAGAMVGNLFWYWVARSISHDRFRGFIDRHGRWLTLDWHDVETVQRPVRPRRRLDRLRRPVAAEHAHDHLGAGRAGAHAGRPLPALVDARHRRLERGARRRRLSARRAASSGSRRCSAPVSTAVIVGGDPLVCLAPAHLEPADALGARMGVAIDVHADARHRPRCRSGSSSGWHGRAAPAARAGRRRGRADGWRSCGASACGVVRSDRPSARRAFITARRTISPRSGPPRAPRNSGSSLPAGIRAERQIGLDRRPSPTAAAARSASCCACR